MLIIYGPTAVGKTDIALELAQHIPAEIINMDVGQFYSPLSIGTAKPEWKNHPVPHHLFDIIDAPKNITVVQYNELLIIMLREVWSRGKLPILVGGSGFYLKSILFPPADSAEQKIQIDEIDDTGIEIWDQLYAIDPTRAEQLHKNDIYRIKRALAIWQTTGKKPSEQKALYQPPCDYTLIMFTRDRQELYNRIDKRVIQMIDAGWIEEAKALRDTEWENFLKTKKIIGYEEILYFLENSQSQTDLSHLITTLQQRTRNYAKRQLTFWTSLEKNLSDSLSKQEKKSEIHSEFTSINLTLCDVDLYIKQLLAQLSEYFCDE